MPFKISDRLNDERRGMMFGVMAVVSILAFGSDHPIEGGAALLAALGFAWGGRAIVIRRPRDGRLKTGDSNAGQNGPTPLK